MLLYGATERVPISFGLMFFKEGNNLARSSVRLGSVDIGGRYFITRWFLIVNDLSSALSHTFYFFNVGEILSEGWIPFQTEPLGLARFQTERLGFFRGLSLCTWGAEKNGYVTKWIGRDIFIFIKMRTNQKANITTANRKVKLQDLILVQHLFTKNIVML